MRLAPAFGGTGEWVGTEPAAVVWQDDAGAWMEVGRRRNRVEALWPALERALLDAGTGSWAVGYCGYEWAPTVEPLVAVPPGRASLPLAWWAVVEGTGACRRLESPCEPPGKPAMAGCSLSNEDFKQRVEWIRERIAAGDVYQVNLTRRWQASGVADPAALFTRLSGGRMPRYGAFLADDRQGWSILCLSPELLLARSGVRVETRPIKGTRWRSAGREGRVRAEAELVASAKDAAELAMIVDLERNDLNRVCRPGSVRVCRAASTVAAGDVVHREAVVSGELAEGTRWADILAAVFPGGSVTGAPKLAACRAIAALEPVPRGVYCGLLGVLRPSGDAVFALPIRTGVMIGDTVHFHAGGGIVWDSDPVAEEQESRDKVARWLRVLGGEV